MSIGFNAISYLARSAYFYHNILHQLHTTGPCHLRPLLAHDKQTTKAGSTTGERQAQQVSITAWYRNSRCDQRQLMHITQAITALAAQLSIQARGLLFLSQKPALCRVYNRHVSTRPQLSLYQGSPVKPNVLVQNHFLQSKNNVILCFRGCSLPDLVCNVC